MAFYAAGHYSRAFISMRQAESTTESAGLIAAFIRKDTKVLINRIASILLRDTPLFENQSDLDEWVITIAIARSLASALEYIFTGDKDYFDEANQTLYDASLIATAGLSPAYWLIVRLLRLMLNNLEDTSLWKNLPQFFSPESKNNLNQYIRLMAFSKPPVIELWMSQRSALSLALDSTNRGGVINLRTSAGKTLIAELAILQTLSSDPASRIIYLAPFRSLAFEIERTLSVSLSWLGFRVSHLYGGSRVSYTDMEMASESSVFIATPEKARALFRAFPEIFENVKLIIIDEGHLIGPSERYVKNELFIDHLRSFARSKRARILLLSAVIPITKELAEWVTGDQGSVASSQWKPSTERFGLLKWNGSRVRINWLGKIESFNPSFVKAKPLGFSNRRTSFPHNKHEAIAAAAVRLSSIGPVMIFTGKAVSVPTLAESVLLALGEDPEPHPWPEHEWKVFKAVCAEELDPNSIEIEAARLGVICHSNRLTPQVRMAIEHLMRSRSPKVIIATTTLGQGVNVGISSVIVATPYIGKERISQRDFWHICGRAGRAFVDGEGKILYAIDEVITKTRTTRHVEKDEDLARQYFDFSATDRVESGLLYVINQLRDIANQAGVSFDVLIELVANNEFKVLGVQKQYFEAVLNLLDDEILSFHEDLSIKYSNSESVEWVDQAFRELLAVIQARTGINQSNTADVIQFLQARARYILKQIPDRTTRKAIVASGLPLSVALKAHENLDLFRVLADEYIQSDFTFISLTITVKRIESWARDNASSITEKMPDESALDKLRSLWLGGTGLRELIKQDSNATVICKDFYGYQLPWIIHAISQKFDKAVEKERISALSQIALLVEIGVPTELAARIFLAGIRSRAAATELSRLDISFGTSISAISRNLHNPDFIDGLIPQISQPTVEWLNLIQTDESYRRTIVPRFSNFKLKQSVNTNTLYARTFGEGTFLCSLDGRIKFSVKSTVHLPFNQIADDLRFVFKKSGEIWVLTARDLRLE